jgi:hypothetical protein
MTTYNLTDVSDVEYVNMCEKQHDPTPFEKSVASFELLALESQIQADAKKEAQQACLKSFLDDRNQNVPADAIVTVNDDALGAPASLSW